MQEIIVPTPIGPYRVLASANGITEIDPYEVGGAAVNRGAPADSGDAASEHLERAALWLRAYFAGERPDPDQLALDVTGTAFQQTVWRSLQRIPYGETRTYADIARELGRDRGSARAIGGANGSNPVSIVIPCHRVIAAGGKLGGYGGGLERKRFLLNLEGAALMWQPTS